MFFLVLALLQLTHRITYWLNYSDENEQAEWVLYYLSLDRIKGTTKRTNDFRPDPKISTGSAMLQDYIGSGYDRGHLCPAADNTHSREAMSDSFYLSNMSPQQPGFNRGIWKRLENAVRDWCQEKGALIVVCGGVLEEKELFIGENKVTVPRSYYKILLKDSGAQPQAIGFLLPNENSKFPLSYFTVPIDSIEMITGIDFFYKLSSQDSFETNVYLEDWF